MASKQRLAKFTMPRQRGVIGRSRLFDVLIAARDAPGLWIEGPPGAGKTTLAASYVQAEDLPCLWFRVDDADNDLAELFGSLSRAAGETPAARRLPVFTPEHAPDKALAFARRYFRALYERLPARCCLVFDNLHEIDTSVALEVMRVAVEEAPSGAQVVLLSRSAPPPEFAALEAARKLERLDAEALRFTQDELQALLPRHDALAVASIRELTQGWSAGIVLAARCWHPSRAPAGKGAAGDMLSESKEAIFRFFAHEVLSRMPAHEQRFLELVSLLPEMSVEQAEALTGQDQAARILESAYRRNLFTTYRRGDPNTYQFHALFREYLLGRAQTHVPAEALRATRRHAAELLLAADDVAQALELLVGAREWQSASNALVASAPLLLRQGRYATLRRWIETIPDEILNQDPRLLYWMGQARGHEDEIAACPWYELAYGRLDASSDGALGQVRCAAAAISAIYAAQVTHKELALWGERLRDSLDRLPGPMLLADDLAVAMALALASIAGKAVLPEQQTLAIIDRLLKVLEADPSNVDADIVTIGRVLTTYCLPHGGIPMFVRLCELVEPQLLCARASPLARSRWLISKSVCSVQIASRPGLTRWIDSARTDFEGARAIVDKEGLSMLEFDLLELESLFANAANNQSLRAELLFRAGAVLDAQRPIKLLMYCVQLCGARLLRGEVAEALQVAARGHAAAREASIGGAEALLNLCTIEACALIAAGRVDEAVALMAGLASELTSYERLLADTMLHLTQALQFEHGDPATFQAQLRLGLRSAAEAGYANFFNSLPAIKSRLCAHALTHGIETEFVLAVIRLRRLAAPCDAGANWPWRVRVNVLGPFELNVDGKAIDFGPKTPRRQVELLQAIALSGHAGLSTWQATDWLWPDGESGKNPLDVTLHRLRKLLGDANAIQIQNGSLVFDRSTVWSDVAQFDGFAAHLLDADLAALSNSELQAHSVRVLALYRGPLLAGSPQSVWMLGAREQLHARFERVVQALAAQIERRALWAAALDLYARALEHDNLAEEFYRGQMRCHLALAQPAEALNAFRRCRHLLSVVLGVAPSAQTLALVQDLRGASELRQRA